MSSFGWLTGIDYSEHLSTSDKSVFSCVLVMPWASTDENYDPAKIPRISAAECDTKFHIWLTPWKTKPVTWKLWNATKAIWLEGSKREVAIKPSQTFLQSSRTSLQSKCADHLSTNVRGHTHAMSLTPEDRVNPGKTESPHVWTYPLASGGLAHLPATVSDAVLGTSAVWEVRHVKSDNSTQLSAGDFVVAVPVFEPDNTHKVEPQNPTKTQEQYAINYDLNGATPPDGYELRCIGGAVKVGTPAAKSIEPHEISITSAAPQRAVYADVARLLNPAVAWVHLLKQANDNDRIQKDFQVTLVKLLGCGAAEVDLKDPPQDPSKDPCKTTSILELLVKDENLVNWFDSVPRKQFGYALREKFESDFSDKTLSARLLGYFCQCLPRCAGLSELSDQVLILIEYDPTIPLGEAHIDAAERLVGTMTTDQPVARAAWICWLIALLETWRDTGFITADDEFTKAVNKLSASAKHAAAQPDKPDPAPTLLQEDCLRLLNGHLDYIDGIPDSDAIDAETRQFWEALHRHSDVPTGLKAFKGSFLQALLQRVGLDTALFRAKAVEFFDSQVKLLEDKAGGALPNDFPLQLRFAAKTPNRDEAIRGYILALRTGVPRTSGDLDWETPVWITSHQATVDNKTLDDGKDPIWLTETIGATSADGLAVVATEYDGLPLNVHVRGEETSSFIYEPTWPKDKDKDEYPRLGYGLHYQGIAGTVDNAGAIVQPALRISTYVGEPIREAQLNAVFPAGKPEGYPYLSRQVPGLAVFSDFDDFGLSHETLTHQELRQQEEKDLKANGKSSVRYDKVAILYKGPDKESDYVGEREKLTLKLHAPTCSTTFARRWLNADRTAAKDSAFRWAKVKKHEGQEIEELIKALPEDPKDKQKQQVITHPAIEKIRLTVRWYNYKGEEVFKKDQTLDLNHLNDKTSWIFQEHFVVTLQLSDANDIDAAQNIKCKSRHRAKIEVHSLIPKNLVDSKWQRLKKVVLDQDHYKVKGDYYISNSATTLWVECLPDSVADPIPDLRPELKLRYPGADATQELAVSLKGTAKFSAQWIAGFRIEPKRWKWSGYPIEFPSLATSNLDQWVPLYAGTDNDMPRHGAGQFVTQWTPSDTTPWTLKLCVMEPLKLPAPRVAMHVGLEVTPTPRFARLLKAEVAARFKTAYLYATVPGVTRWDDPDNRLPPPVWREAIPLPQTVTMSGNQRRNTEKGVLLLLDSPLYDTSDTAHFGGVGERVELEVVDTWVKDINESGVNPIFHHLEKLNEPATDESKGLSFVTDAPFGIGYDLGKAGNPAQTGIVIRPEKGRGKWLLAKCRMRRLMMPESVMDSKISLDKKGKYNIPLRRVDEEWVPMDFVVTTTKSEKLTLTVDVDGKDYALTLPADSEAGNYLVTWHKERWASAKPAWRPQVNYYVANTDKSHWALLKRSSPYKQAAFQSTPLPALSSSSSVKLMITGGNNPEVRKMLVSDFTSSRWLSFIGSFGKSFLENADNYHITKHTTGGKDTFELGVAPEKGGEIPDLHPLDALQPSLLMLIKPVADVMRGQLEEEGGELVGVYARKSMDSTAFDEKLFLKDKVSLKGCKALLIQSQRPHLNAASTLDLTSYENSLIEALFPKESEYLESGLRLLPEYLGPIKVHEE